MNLDDVIPAEAPQAESMADPAYRAEHGRTLLANDVAIRVLAYRQRNGLSQTAFGRLMGMRQPNVARLEAGDHEPSLSTLARLAIVLGERFTIDIAPDGTHLRPAA